MVWVFSSVKPVAAGGKDAVLHCMTSAGYEEVAFVISFMLIIIQLSYVEIDGLLI